MLEFEARCVRMHDDDWHWRVVIKRHGHVRDEVVLRDDYEMEALANAIDTAMIPHKKDEDWDWAKEYVKKISAVVVKNLSEEEVRAAAKRLGYRLVKQ